jgi:hypothetical protein
MGIALVGPPLERPIDETPYRGVFTALGHDGADAILVSFEPENMTNLKLIVELAAKNRLPAIHPLKVYVEAGTGGDVLWARPIGTRPCPCPHIRSDAEGKETRRHSDPPTDQV